MTLDQLSWLERSCLILSLTTDFPLQEMAQILQVTEEEVCEATLRGYEQFFRSHHVKKACLPAMEVPV